MENVKLVFEKEYSNYKEFYQNNKTEIYTEIIKLFYLMKNDIENEYTISICWNVNDFEINTDIKYNKLSIDQLNYLILPHFEKIEEYERCSEIKKLYNDLCLIIMD